MDTFVLSIVGIVATVMIGYGIVKLADFIEWLRKRNMSAFLKYPMIALLFIAAVVLVILM